MKKQIVANSSEKTYGIISRDPVIKCKTLYISPVTIIVDGKMMGYVTHLAMSSQENAITVERMLPKKDGLGYEKVCQTIIGADMGSYSVKL